MATSIYRDAMDGKIVPEFLRDYFQPLQPSRVFQFLAPIAGRFARALRDCFLLHPLTPRGAILVSFTLHGGLPSAYSITKSDKMFNGAFFRPTN